MRHKIVTILTAGAVGATSFALAGSALASSTAPVAATVATAATAATSQLERIKAALSGLVKDKTITQAQADKVAETLKSTDLGKGGPGGRGGPGGPGGAHGPGGPGLAAAATTLKMTEADLRTALEGGKTLAAVAKEKSVSLDTLVAALVKAEKAQIALEVKEGRLTQAKADERLKDITTRVTKQVNSTRPARPDHDRGTAPDPAAEGRAAEDPAAGGTATEGSASATPST